MNPGLILDGKTRILFHINIIFFTFLRLIKKHYNNNLIKSAKIMPPSRKIKRHNKSNSYGFKKIE